MLSSEGLIRVKTIAAACVLAALVAVLVLWGARPAEAAFPGENGKIAFTSFQDGDKEIFAMNPDRTGLEQLTDNTAVDSDPAWSANGRLIAWGSYQDGNSEIYIRNYIQTLFLPRRLTTNTASDSRPAFSPDGTKIAFMSDRDGNYEIYVMDTADSNPADGNGDNQTNLTNNAAYDSWPAFSPDGTKIAFTSFRGGNYEIYVMDSDGTDQTNLSNNPAVDGHPAFSPDGTKIAFTSLRDGNANIYVMNALDGSSQKRLTKKAPDDLQPVWSPDGKKIAFVSVRGGGDGEIYVMKAKPEGRKNRPKNLTKNDVLDERPDWQPIPQP